MFVLLRSVFRLILVILHIFLGIILSSILFFPYLSRLFPTRLAPFVVSNWSYVLCKICGLRIQLHGTPAPAPILMVANHISWLDIFALLGTFYVKFVSKSEVAHWPLVGYLSWRVGTLYIRRGRSEAMKGATQLMVSTLKNQERVLFFPEGTSTDGKQVQRFHARLFQAAMDAQVKIQPIAIRYPTEDGVSSVAPFIGDDDFASHLWRVLKQPHLDIEIHFLPCFDSTHQKRRDLANHAQQAISTVLSTPLS